MSLIAELKRRNVFKVAAAYVVVSWLVLQIVDTLGDMLQAPDSLGKIVVILLVAGFPVALFLAWAYELTPEGVKKAEEVTKDESITHVTGQKINYTIIGLMAIALAYFVWESRFSAESPVQLPPAESVAEEAEDTAKPEPAIEEKADVSLASIAVLPFADLSQEKDQEYFTDGISEELLNLLAGVQNLKVTSRTSAFSFKGKDVSIQDIASKLKVAHVLEGSVRKAGDTIRITAQLIRASDDAHLWSSTYDRKLENIFAIQDEIATAIVDALMPHLGMQAKPKVKTLQATNPEAHRLTLLARHYIGKRTEADLRQAVQYLEQALALDDNYAPAHAAIAQSWLLLDLYADVATTEAMAKARPHIDKAMKLDPTLADAYAVEGVYAGRMQNDTREMEMYNKALELNPSYSEVKTWKARLLASQLNITVAIDLFREVIEIDPLFGLGLANYAHFSLSMGKLEEAARFTPMLMETNPAFAKSIEQRIHAIEGKIQLRLPDTLNVFESMSSPFVRNDLSVSFSSFGLWPEAEAISKGYFRAEASYLLLKDDIDSARLLVTTRALEDPDDYQLMNYIGAYFQFLGDYEKACSFYQKAWDKEAGREEWLRSNEIILAYFARCSALTGKDIWAIKLEQYLARRLKIGKDQGVNPPEYWQIEYLYLLLQGKVEQALDIYQQAWKEGLWDGFIKVNTKTISPQTLKNPRFQKLWQQQTETLHRYGREFLQKVCKENPWKEHWQPEPGSCEKVGGDA